MWYYRRVTSYWEQAQRDDYVTVIFTLKPVAFSYMNESNIGDAYDESLQKYKAVLSSIDEPGMSL